MHPSIRNFINAVPPEAPQYSNTSPIVVEVHNFPITPEELEAQRKIMRNHNLITAIGFFLGILLLVVEIYRY